MRKCVCVCVFGNMSVVNVLYGVEFRMSLILHSLIWLLTNRGRWYKVITIITKYAKRSDLDEEKMENGFSFLYFT